MIKKGLSLAVVLQFCLTLVVGPQLARAEGQMMMAMATGMPTELLLFQEIPMVSIASKKSESIFEAPASVSVITAEEIKKYGYKTIWDAIRTLPGIEVRRGTFHRPRMLVRGIDSTANEKTLVMVNGMAFNSFAWGPGTDEIFATIPIENIKAIEVMRGPASALYGSGGIAGIINLITKKGRDYDGVELKTQASINPSYHNSIGAGIKMDELEASGFAYHSIDRGQALDVPADAQTFLPVFDASALPPSKVVDFEENWIAEARLGYKKTEFNAVYYRFNTPGYISWISAEPEDEEFRNAQKVDTAILNMNLKSEFDITEQFKVTPELGLLYGGFEDSVTMWYPAATRVDPSNKFHNAKAELRLDYEVNEQHDLLGGAGYTQEVIDDVYFTNARANNAPNSEGDWMIEGTRNNLYAFLEYQSKWLEDKLKLSLAARFDQYEIEEIDQTKEDYLLGGDRGTLYPIGQPKNYSGIKPRIALVYQASEESYYKLLFNKAFRMPNAAEITKASPFSWGNPDLTPEHMTMLELSTSHVYKTFNINFNAFYGLMENRILREVRNDNPDRGVIYTSPYTFPGDSFLWRNYGALEQYGAELEARVKLMQGLSAKATFSGLYGQSQKDGEKATGIIPFICNIGIDYAPMDNLMTAVEVLYRGPVESFKGTPAPYDEGFDPYTLVNLNVNYEVIKSLDINLTCKNVFDTKYFDIMNHALFMPAGYPARGRELIASIAYKF